MSNDAETAVTSQLMTKKEVAQMFKRTPRTIEVWMRDGFPHLKLGRSVFFRREAIDQYLAECSRLVRPPASTARQRRMQLLLARRASKSNPSA